MTAHDFAYAWQRVLNPATGSPNASLLYDVAGARAFHQGEGVWADVGIKAIDEGTLIVELEAPAGYFLQLMANSATYPVPRHVVEACGEAWSGPDKIVTNGPFRLASWVRGESLVLTRDPQYHGHSRGNVHCVELSLLPVEQRLATALGLYEQDCLDVLDLDLLSVELGVRARQRFPDCITTPRLTICYLAFHPQRSPFDDPLVRRAFFLATDREWLSNVLWQGTWSPPSGGFVPSGMPGHATGIALPYDPDQARDLLAEAGYVGGQGFPSLHALTFRGWESDLEALSQHWHINLGVKVDWEVLEFAGFLQRLACDLPHMYFLLWGADYPDPDSFLRLATERLTSHWRNQAYNGLVEQARGITDQAERMKLYEQADRMLVQEAVITPLAYWREHQLVKPWITRYPTSAAREFMWKDVVIEPH